MEVVKAIVVYLAAPFNLAIALAFVGVILQWASFQTNAKRFWIASIAVLMIFSY